MVKTTYNSTEDLINKLQQLKGKTKLKFNKNISNYHDEKKQRIFQTQDDPLFKNAQGISKNYDEVLLLRKFLETKPQVKNLNFNYYDLYYTITKKDNEEEQNKNDYFNFIDFITPNHYIETKNNNVILGERVLRS